MTDEEMIAGGRNGGGMMRLAAIMHRLRAPGGCPWDAEQTHRSLISNLIEESYETVDAIMRGDDRDLEEELGDLLLQVVFHCEIAGEEGRFGFEEVAEGICEKLVRRHPHVFGNAVAGDPDAVLKQWDEIKRGEKGEEDVPYLQGTGKGLPALVRAAKLQKKAAKVGCDLALESDVLSKIRKELSELEAAVDSGEEDKIGEELGDLMFAVVNLARFRSLDPEMIMAGTNAKFERRFGEMERILKAGGGSLERAGRHEITELWAEVKEAGDVKGGRLPGVAPVQEAVGRLGWP